MIPLINVKCRFNLNSRDRNEYLITWHVWTRREQQDSPRSHLICMCVCLFSMLIWMWFMRCWQFYNRLSDDWAIIHSVISLAHCSLGPSPPYIYHWQSLKLFTFYIELLWIYLVLCCCSFSNINKSFFLFFQICEILSKICFLFSFFFYSKVSSDETEWKRKTERLHFEYFT